MGIVSEIAEEGGRSAMRQEIITALKAAADRAEADMANVVGVRGELHLAGEITGLVRAIKIVEAIT